MTQANYSESEMLAYENRAKLSKIDFFVGLALDIGLYFLLKEEGVKWAILLVIPPICILPIMILASFVNKYRVSESKDPVMELRVAEYHQLKSIELERQRAEAAKRREDERKKVEYWKNYVGKGHEFESVLCNSFTDRGFKAQKTKGSGDGGVDIHLQTATTWYLIQCKAHTNPCGPAQVRELFGVLQASGSSGKKAILVCLGGFTKGASDFAKETGVILWDSISLVDYFANKKSLLD
jgi:restriction endonuclease Mrr